MSLATSLRQVGARPFAAPLRQVWRELTRPIAAPERVLRAISEAEQASEIVVGWVQLAGVGFFLALYTASLSAFDMRAGLQPVPIALALYAAFVAWRLRRAYAGPLTRVILSASAIADVAVLMVLIWSFTLQYAAPAALYLKGPTLFYAFVLIALRALRFDAMQVVFTGAAAVLGWLVLVLIAAQTAPIVNDYPTYMTTLSVLWGAEAEKMTALLAATLVLALAVCRSRALLARTAIEAAAAHDLSRFLDADVAKRVRSATAQLKPGDGELKPMAIMFLDLRGFSTAAATLTPPEVIALLQQYQSRFVPIVERAGASVDKYLGDGILVSFGGGAKTGSEAADAFSIVPDLIAAGDSWAAERAAAGLPPLGVAVAITHGEVVHGVIGHDDRLEFTVIGDAVNLAAKLEKHAKVEQARVIATREAFERAAMQGHAHKPARMIAAAQVEGAPAPVDLVVIA